MLSSCIFGSTARNSIDSYSDKDVLIVSSSEDELSEASRDWSSDGWSISMFTNQQIIDMANRGSLFIQHLKQESVILRDDQEFLSSVMRNFRPNDKYEDGLVDSLTLLKDIVSAPRGYWPTLCSADIAYVSIRNIAIARLASKGIYKFDYNDLIDHFAYEQPISAIQLNALKRLRLLKYSYRNRLMPTSSRNTLHIALKGADKLFQHSKPLQNAPTQGSYRDLRLLELQLVTKASPTVLDKLPQDDPLGVAWRIICDPRGYPDQPKISNPSWMQEISLLAHKRFTSHDLIK